MGTGLGKRAVQMAMGERVAGGRRQVPGESCEGGKDERQESLPTLLPQPSTPPLLPSLPQPVQSCRALLGSIAPGISTACGWTDLRGNTESSGVRRGTLVPVEGGERQGTVRFEFKPPHAQRGPGTGILEPTLIPQHPKSSQTHGGWSCGKFPPLHQVPQS